MQHVDSFLKSDCVDCPPSVAAVLGDNLDDRSSTKALQRLGRGISVTLLRGVESAWPMSRRTASGKLRTSLLLEPSQTTGLISSLYINTSTCIGVISYELVGPANRTPGIGTDAVREESFLVSLPEVGNYDRREVCWNACLALILAASMKMSKRAAEQVEQGMEASGDTEKAFLVLAERFRAENDPERVKQLGWELGEAVFGERN
jgi:hypothetical protein